MRVLMLGNSLTTANGLPDMLATRLDAQVVVHARGGARLAEHMNPGTQLGFLTIPALSERKWDYVVLQEMSNAPLKNTMRFLFASEMLCAQARDIGAQPVIYASWAYAPGCPKLEKLGVTHEQMHEAMHVAFLKAAEDDKAVLADAGTAFFEHPDKAALYAPDGVHPSMAGSELAADCLVAAITGNPRAASAQRGAGEVPYYVYMLLCEDGSYYTGIATDVERRFQEHKERGPKAARYTRSHPVKKIAAVWEMPDRSEASKIEAFIKRLSHSEKALLAIQPTFLDLFLR